MDCRGWRIALVDQRNHGRSAEVAGFKPPHTMQAAAKDLMDLVQKNFGGQQLDMIVGHSLGGKSTLEFLSQVSQAGSKVSPPQQVKAMLQVTRHGESHTVQATCQHY